MLLGKRNVLEMRFCLTRFTRLLNEALLTAINRYDNSVVLPGQLRAVHICKDTGEKGPRLRMQLQCPNAQAKLQKDLMPLEK